MNKKKFLAMLVSLCLVAALGVGATLALFSDTTNKLTNKQPAVNQQSTNKQPQTIKIIMRIREIIKIS